ncbi:hypothetical protein AB0L00_02885 [Actinoallomurus sp. NPDC052308]|uniref:hypothetical protein n=1 Tax=Actinoallomurus sp. NPDC052308 TaxID=3155530 RepID=UPI00343E822B
MSPECTAGPPREQQWSCRLDGDPYAVVTARALTTGVLLGWNADLVEDVILAPANWSPTPWRTAPPPSPSP